MLNIARNRVRITGSYYLIIAPKYNSVLTGDNITTLFIWMLMKRNVVFFLIKHLSYHCFRAM